MPADLVPARAIPHLAEQVSPAMRRVLQLLRDRGFIQNGPDIEPTTATVLQRLTALGLVDPGYSGSVNGDPFIWVSNGNGEKVLRYLEKSPQQPNPQLTIHARAATALTSLPENEQIEVLTAAEALLGRDPASWPHGEAARLDPDKPVFLLRVSPQLRAFIRPVEGGAVELFDIVREDTLRLFLQRYGLGASVG
jgi:hypothetical protein